VTSPSDSVDAADIRRVDDAQIIWTDAVPTVGGAPGQVRLEPEVARAFSVRLGEVIRSVAEMETQLSPQFASLPTLDPVSSNAARQTWRMLDDARTYLAAWRRSLSEARAALGSQLSAYEETERRNVGLT
jgi:hypothetical protein